jgi:hypothetical protein
MTTIERKAVLDRLPPWFLRTISLQGYELQDDGRWYCFKNGHHYYLIAFVDWDRVMVVVDYDLEDLDYGRFSKALTRQDCVVGSGEWALY